MAEATARAMLALGRGQSSGHYIVDHHDEFLYDCDEDAAYAWNQLSGGLPEAVQGDYHEGVLTFHYRGREWPLSLRHNRGDGLLQMHALAQLVREDSELRLCLDSVGNSELAFLPLPPAVWAALEQEFGRELVDYRFLRLPDDVDAIEPALEALDVLGRSYPDDYTPPPPPDPKQLACDAALAALRALLEPVYPQIVLGWSSSTTPKQMTLKLFVKTLTDAEMEQLRSNTALLRQLRTVIRPLCQQLPAYFRGFSYASEEQRQRIIREKTGELLGGPPELPGWWNKPDPAPQPAPVAAPPAALQEIPALGKAAQGRADAWARAEPELRQLLSADYPAFYLGYGVFSIRASRSEGPVLYLITPTAAEINKLRADEVLLRRLRPAVQAWCREQGQEFLGFSFGSDDNNTGLLPVDGGQRSGGWPELPAWWRTPEPAGPVARGDEDGAWAVAEPLLREILRPEYPTIYLRTGLYGRKIREFGYVLLVITPTAAEMQKLRSDEALLRRLRPALQAWCEVHRQEFWGFSFGADDGVQRALFLYDRSADEPVLPDWWNTPEAPVKKPELQLVAMETAGKPEVAVAARPATPAAAAAVAKPATAPAQAKPAAQNAAASRPAAAQPATPRPATPQPAAPQPATPKSLAPPPAGGMQVACPNCNTRFNVRPTAAQPLLGAVRADCPNCGWRISLGFTSATRMLLWLPVLFFLGLNLIGGTAAGHVIVTLLAALFGGPLLMERKVRQRIVRRG